MNRHIAFLGLAAALLAPQPTYAEGNRNCAPRPAVLERLASAYGESRHAIGLGAKNRVIEIFRSQEQGSWTITVTLPNGVTCLVASGIAFEVLDEALAPQGTES